MEERKRVRKKMIKGNETWDIQHLNIIDLSLASFQSWYYNFNSLLQDFTQNYNFLFIFQYLSWDVHSAKQNRLSQ